MSWLISLSIRSRILIVSLFIIFLAICISDIRDMPLGIYPEFSPVYVEVQTEALGLSADEVEQLITLSLEQDLFNGIAWLDEIWSQSMPGLSSIVLIFEPGTDPMQARQMVAERLTQAHALPNVSKPPVMLQPYSSTSRVMIVGMSSVSPDLSLIDMSVLARWTIQPYLMGVEGVANVSIWGQRKRQLQVLVDPVNLKAKNVALNDVVKTTGEALWVSPLSYLNSSTPGTGGFFDTPNQRLGIRHVSPISTQEDLAKVSVVGHDLVLGNIADVVENHQPLIGDAIVHGKPGLMLVIEKFPWSGTLEVTERVEEALELLKPGLSGIVFDHEIYQPSNFIEASFTNLATVLSIAVLLVICTFFLLFHHWKDAVIGIISIIVSVLTAIYILHLGGVGLNTTTIAGLLLALGMIIDDGITGPSHVRRQLDRQVGPGKISITLNTIERATNDIRSPIFIATLITIFAALPIYYLVGKAGEFIRPVTVAFVLAFIVSGLIALTLTPALSAIFYSNDRQASKTYIPSKIHRIYQNRIGRLCQKPGFVYLGMVAIILAGLLVLPSLKSGPMLPLPEERDVMIKFKGIPGTSHTEMYRITDRILKELATVPGIQNLGAHIGRAVMSDEVSNVNSSNVWVSMDDDQDYQTMLTDINEIIDGYPGIDHELIGYRTHSVEKPVRVSDPFMAVRIYGENQEVLESKAEEVKLAISNIEGIGNLRVDTPESEPTIEIKVDLEAARKYAVKPGDVRRAAAIFLAGIEVGSLFEDQKIFDVVVWGTPKSRNSLTAVKELLINAPNGDQVRLGDVAEVRVTPVPGIIRRESVSRYLDVLFDYGGSSTRLLSKQISLRLKEVHFPLEFHAKLVGNYAEMEANRSNMIRYFIAAIIGIFLLLQASFRSWRLALVILIGLAVPISAGVLSMYFTGTNLSIGSVTGLLLVFGISVYHVILVIRQFSNLVLHEGQTFSLTLILSGLESRFRPILMTGLCVTLVLTTIIIFGNVPGLEIIYPMAIVGLGGMLGSILLSLVILPILYFKFGQVSEAAIEEERAMLEMNGEYG